MNAAHLDKLATALEAWRTAYARSPDDDTTLYRERSFWLAITDVIDDGDVAAALEAVEAELHIDSEGNDLDDFGDVITEFNPSLVHPDNPTQRGGWL